jgi:hypothetical protein
MRDLRIDITEAEILADLSWPGPPPGRWSTEQRAGEVARAGGEVRKPSAVLHSVTATVKPKMPTGSRTSVWAGARAVSRRPGRPSV